MSMSDQLEEHGGIRTMSFRREVRDAMSRLERSTESINARLDATYVRQDVWAKSEQGAGARVGEVVKEQSDLKTIIEKLETKIELREESSRKERNSDRRLLIGAFLTAAGPWVLSFFNHPAH